MPRGSKPGEHRGGRKVGTPNLKTLEKQLLAKNIADAVKEGRRKKREEDEAALARKAEIAASEIQKAEGQRKLLAKEVLDQYMTLFAGMSARYQPIKGNKTPNEKKFNFYAEKAIDCAHKLAPYQSPRLQALAIAPVPDAQSGPRRFTLKIFDNDTRTIVRAPTDDPHNPPRLMKEINPRDPPQQP